MTETNEPRLRFKGFDEEWNNGHISDIGVVKMNKRIHKDETSNDGEVPFFKIGTFGKKPDAFITRKRFLELKDKYPYPETGDILISASGTLGRTVVYKGKDEYFQDSNIIWLDLNDKKMLNPFLLQFYNQHRWQSEGTTIKRLYNKDIYRTSICYPGLNEQQKIGSFFSKLDKILELQNQKLEQLKKLKQGYLQKMFPQDGESVPRLRFNGFSDTWKEERLSSICRCETSKYTQGQFKESKNKGNNVVFDVSGISGKDSNYDQENEYISIVKDGSGVGKVSLRPAKTSVINTMNYILSDNENIKFIYYLLQKFDFRRFKIGTGIPHIYFSDYSKTIVKIPEIEEQKRISSFLGNLDSLISVTENKIDGLKQQKKAYLQKMFI